MRILYLYAELMGYQIPILKEYVERYNAEVHVFHWDHKKLTQYQPPLINRVYYYERSKFSAKEMREYARNINPDIVYISGLMDMGYLWVARMLRLMGIPVVIGFDGIYRGSLRQRITTFISPLLIRKFYSHIWVAGPYQFAYASRLGFRNDEIVFYCYSADVNIFNEAYHKTKKTKQVKYPHRFSFVGRFEPVKGVDLLVQAWGNLQGKRKDWELHLIGNGSLQDELKGINEIKVSDFMNSIDLARESEQCGCFILPSRSEPWGVVIHEHTSAGLPILCTDVCGAAAVLVTPNFNGYLFKPESVKEIEKAILRIINTPDDKLFAMAANSHLCGQRITPEMSAAAFLSILQ